MAKETNKCVSRDKRVRLLEISLRIAKDRIADLEAQLAALTWTEISESNLPKVGDEVLRIKIRYGSQYRVRRVEIVESDWKEGWLQREDAIVYAEYRRPLNPPDPEKTK